MSGRREGGRRERGGSRSAAKRRRDELLREIVGSPDRDHCPGTLPIVSVHQDEEPEFLDAVDSRRKDSARLHRRGADHGEWAELDALELLPDFRREVGPGPGPWTGRWHESQPIVLRSIVPGLSAEEPNGGGLGEELQQAQDLFEELQEPGGLKSWIESRAERLPREWEISGRRASGPADPERDLERVGFRHVPASGSRSSGAPFEDLWLKSGWLSTHPDDRSLRVRVSFGKEGLHDASADERGHALVPDLAEALLPAVARVAGREIGVDAPLRAVLDEVCGREVFFSQHIAYWNAPEGGALFHHDAFGDPDPSGQYGVAYVQLSGRTAWLALSIADLADRVAEFGEALAEGELPWVRKALFGDGVRFDAFQKKLEDPEALVRELGLPGQGTLGPLVNHGPEFTGFLADCGHGFFLREGDAILLPNRGTRRTAMHSVFAAPRSEADVEPGYALSLAVRPRQAGSMRTLAGG